MSHWYAALVHRAKLLAGKEAGRAAQRFAYPGIAEAAVANSGLQTLEQRMLLSGAGLSGDATRSLFLAEASGARTGDIDGSGAIDAADVDRLRSHIAAAAPYKASLDLIPDGVIDLADLDHLIRGKLGTRTGDLDLNGNVSLTDFFRAGAALGIDEGVTYVQGDLDGDGNVTLGDLSIIQRDFGFDGGRSVISIGSEGASATYGRRATDLQAAADSGGIVFGGAGSDVLLAASTSGVPLLITADGDDTAVLAGAGGYAAGGAGSDVLWITEGDVAFAGFETVWVRTAADGAYAQLADTSDQLNRVDANTLVERRGIVPDSETTSPGFFGGTLEVNLPVLEFDPFAFGGADDASTAAPTGDGTDAGGINGDGRVDAADIDLLARYLHDPVASPLDAEMLRRADVMRLIDSGQVGGVDQHDLDHLIHALVYRDAPPR